MISLQNLDEELQESISVEELLATFTQVTENYRDALNHYSLVCAAPTAETLERFRLMPFAAQKDALNQIMVAEWALRELAATRGTTPKIDLAGEKLMARKEIFRRKWMLADASIIDLIDEDDVIEIYDGKGHQVYRSWSVFKFCSYSLIDLQTSDWNTLFARPSWIVEELMKMAPVVFAPGAKTVPYTVDEYLMRERLSVKKNALLFKMKYVAPILDQGSGQTVGFISTGSVKVLEQDGAATRFNQVLEFI